MLVLLIGCFSGDIGASDRFFPTFLTFASKKHQEAQTEDVLKEPGGQKLALLYVRWEVALSVIILTWRRIMAAAFTLSAADLSNLSWTVMWKWNTDSYSCGNFVVTLSIRSQRSNLELLFVGRDSMLLPSSRWSSEWSCHLRAGRHVFSADCGKLRKEWAHSSCSCVTSTGNL